MGRVDAGLSASVLAAIRRRLEQHPHQPGSLPSTSEDMWVDDCWRLLAEVDRLAAIEQHLGLSAWEVTDG